MTTSENKHSTAAQNQSGYEIADRQIEATLALAYEQRTANLIALYGAKDLEKGLTTAQWSATLDQIKERLGL